MQKIGGNAKFERILNRQIIITQSVTKQNKKCSTITIIKFIDYINLKLLSLTLTAVVLILITSEPLDGSDIERAPIL